MGGVLSKGQNQQGEAAAKASEDAVSQKNEQDGRRAEVDTEPMANELAGEGLLAAKTKGAGQEDEQLQEAAKKSTPAQANSVPNAVSDSSIPDDIAHILSSGIHEDVAENESPLSSAIRTANAAFSTSASQSVSSAVADLKAKFGINSGPLQQGELEKIKGEIEASNRESELKERLKRARLAKEQQASKSKGKEKAKKEDSSSSSDDSEGDSSDSDSGSSTSSGSSLGFPARKQKRKRVVGAGGDAAGKEDVEEEEDENEEEDYDDDDSFARPMKLLKGDGSALSAAAAALFASKNEIIEPTFTNLHPEKLPEDTRLKTLGHIDSIIDTVVVVRADITPDSMVLDEGSLITLDDRTVLGPIFETFGAITSPMYSIRYPSSESAPLKNANTKVGTRVYFSESPQYSEKLFSRDIRHLQSLKGSDASNLHDEEPGENEVEFSDDEQELEYKRMLKYEKKQRAMDRQGSYAEREDDEEGELDDEDERPENAGLEDEESSLGMSHVEEYTPLARPTSIGNGIMGSPSSVISPLPSTGASSQKISQKEYPVGASRGRGGRGRGDKSDRGSRGKGGRGGKGNQSGGAPDRHQNGREQRNGQSAPYQTGGRGGGRERGGRRGNERGGRGGRGGGYVSHQHRDHPADQPYPSSGNSTHQRTPSGQILHALPPKPAFTPSNVADMLPYDGPSVASPTTSGNLTQPMQPVSGTPPANTARAAAIEAYNPSSPGPSAIAPPPRQQPQHPQTQQQQQQQVVQQKYPHSPNTPTHTQSQPQQQPFDHSHGRQEAYNPMNNWQHQQSRPHQQPPPQQQQGYNPGFFGMAGIQQFGYPGFQHQQRPMQQPQAQQQQQQTFGFAHQPRMLYNQSPIHSPVTPSQPQHPNPAYQQPHSNSNTPNRPHYQPHKNMTWRPPAQDAPQAAQPQQEHTSGQ